MGENSLRALASDLAYLEAWALAATGAALPWPAAEGLALKFVAHHLWDPVEREADPAHGMPAEVAAALTAAGVLRARRPARARDRPAAPRQLEHPAPLARPARPLRLSGVCAPRIRLAVRASARPRRRKSRRAVTRDILDQLLAVCATDRLADCRDRALLLVAFASGGRRRSEIAGLRVEHCRRRAGRARPRRPRLAAPALPGHPSRPHQNQGADDDARALLIGPPVEALRLWLERADIAKGPIFRAIDRWGALEERA